MLSILFNNLVGIKKIIVPGDFKSHKGNKAVGCSVKAAQGYLFPLKSSVVFIHKPIAYLRHSELKNVEFSRMTGRTFDVTLNKHDATATTFTNIDKEEHDCLQSYFKQAGVALKKLEEH